MPVHMNFPKGRSPRYPRISIIEAIGYARKLYDGAHRSMVDSDTAYRVMGFAGKNGASATVLGALRQFGLVDGLRGDLRISDLALRIFEPSTREEYVEALHEAANKPDAFDALFRHFPDGVPKSDEALRSFLIRSLEFSKNGADDCIASLRNTLAELEASGEREVPAEAKPAAMPSALHQGTQECERISGVETQLAVRGRESEGTELVRIPLTRDCTAELRFSGPITEDAVARLIKYIDLMKDVWTDS